MSNFILVSIYVSCILSVIISIVSISISIFLYVDAMSTKKSTHKIEWVPLSSDGNEIKKDSDTVKDLYDEYDKDLL